MERRRFGSTNRKVAVIGQGTWYILRTAGGASAIAALRCGLDLDMTHIDTAEMCFLKPPIPSTPPKTRGCLTEAEVARIGEAFPLGPGPRHLPTL
jgi:hypothetical protein